MTRKFALVALAVGFLTAASVQADTMYKYTGNPFTFVSGPYTTSDFVSVMLSLASPLAANMPLTQVTPTLFSFSDGVQTITNISANEFLFLFATGPTGNITQWSADGVLPSGGFIKTTNNGRTVTDKAQTINPTGTALNIGSPGRWVLAAAPDVGSSLTLLSLSLTALGVAARRFKRAAA